MSKSYGNLGITSKPWQGPFLVKGTLHASSYPLALACLEERARSVQGIQTLTRTCPFGHPSGLPQM